MVIGKPIQKPKFIMQGMKIEMTRFTKMQAYGNDYVYIDAINQKIDNVNELAKFVSNRHFGIGSDGMVLICKSDVADFRMRMFNPDGTEGEMCGNALRSLSKYVYDHKFTQKEELTIETLGGIQHVKLTVENGQAVNIEANIGKPVLDTKKIPVNTQLPEFIEQEVKVLDKTFKITAVSWGNPHCVMFIDDVDNFDVEKYGKAIEYKTELFPNKTNVTFAQVVDRNTIKIREWERGTGETIGCGTGCCTATVAAVLTGRCNRKVSVHQIGGILETNWDEQTGTMFMKGPSHTVFESEIDVDNIINKKKNRVKKLRRLLENVDYELVKGKLDVDIADIKDDSRKVEENDLYIAKIGSTSNSHKFIPDAIKKGAKAIVIEQDVDILEDVTVIKVKSSRKAMAYISAVYFDNPAEKLVTIGVTGTAGKTSTTNILKKMLEEAGNKVGLIGTIGAFIDKNKIDLHNTTPENYEVQRLFSEMIEAGCKYAIMEVSSQGLKMNRVDGFTFDYGVFTNISNEHIGPNEHESFEEYMYCKSLLFQKCKKGIINVDDKNWENIIKGHTCDIIKFGVNSDEADIKASNIEFIMTNDFLGMGFDVTGKINDKFEVAIPGRFSVYNALCAITIANELGVNTAAMKRALKSISVKGRMELAVSNDKFKLIIDYAHNEDEMTNLMETIMEYKPKRIVCIFGGGGNRARDRRYDMGEISGKYAELTILTQDNPRFEEMESINNDIITGLNRSSGKYITIDDRQEAIEYAMKNAKEGDIILLIGKGHEQYQEIKGVQYYWDEREAVEKAAEKLKI